MHPLSIKQRVTTGGILASLLVFMAGATFAAGSEATPETQMVELPRELSELGPGDVVKIFVWKQPELSQTVTISPAGKIHYPLIGEVQAAGVTMNELTHRLEQELRRHLRDPQVTASLQEVHSYRIYVTGEVLRPGMFQPRGAVTLVQAIAMAGGFTAFASRKDIKVYNRFHRRGRVHFDYEAFVSGAENSEDIVLIPGDTVIVR